MTPSEHAHERAGLAAVRDALPENDPYRAWSNFMFADLNCRLCEVDLLVIGQSGLHLVELTHWQGEITGDGQTWWRDDTTPVDNSRLPGRLQGQAAQLPLEDVARQQNLKVRMPTSSRPSSSTRAAQYEKA